MTYINYSVGSNAHSLFRLTVLVLGFLFTHAVGKQICRCGLKMMYTQVEAGMEMPKLSMWTVL